MIITTENGTTYVVDTVNNKIVGGPLERPTEFIKLVALIGGPMKVDLANGKQLVTSPVVSY